MTLTHIQKMELDFHIKSDDYFGTIATIMGLMADALATDNALTRTRCIKTLNELREDLTFLQSTAKIERKI